MQTCKFGGTEMQATPIGFGSWAIGGARRPDQVDGVVGAADPKLDDAEIGEIESVLRQGS